MNMQEAVDIVSEHLHKGPFAACEVLIEVAAACWREEEGDYRDDVRTVGNSDVFYDYYDFLSKVIIRIISMYFSKLFILIIDIYFFLCYIR